MTLIFVGKIAAAQEPAKVDYFSYVNVCAQGEVKLLDFVEASLLRFQTVRPGVLNSASEDGVLEQLRRDLATLSPVRQHELFSTYRDLKQSMVVRSDLQIVAPAQKDNLLILDGCVLAPVAVSSQTVDRKDQPHSTVLVDKNIWDRLKPYERVAVLLDFALAQEVRAPNLITERVFMGYWFAGRFEKLAQGDWISLSKSIGLPYVEQRGFKIDITSLGSNTLKIFRKMPVRIGASTAMVSGFVKFRDGVDVGFEFSDLFDYELTPGTTVKIHGVGAWSTCEECLVLYDNGRDFQLKAGLITSLQPIRFYDHILDLSWRFNQIHFSSPGVVQSMQVESATVMIRGKAYRVKDPHRIAELSFYPNGQIASATYLEPGQSLEDKTQQAFIVPEHAKVYFTAEGWVDHVEVITKYP